MPASTANALVRPALPDHGLPPLGLSTALVILLTALWGYLRLVVFADSFLALTYVLPLLAGIWTRRHWHVWLMTAAFLGFTALKAVQLGAWAGTLDGQERVFLGATALNILAGAIIVHLLIRYRERLDEQAAVVAAQNVELEAQAEELMQQNEEIRTQSEELAQQNEEISSQGEELTRQNDELHHTNDRLTVRERLLHDLLQSTRAPDAQALRAVCARALAIVGAPATQVALLEHSAGSGLKLLAQTDAGEADPLPVHWPLERSLAGVVLREDRTAYVSDVLAQPELSAPFAPDGPVRSAIATPLRIEGTCTGLLVACGREPAHWTEEQFQLLEWLAAACSPVAKGVGLRETLTARTRELEAANRAKDEFLATLSHELRTPLTPVLAAAGVLATDQRLPADVREDLAMIRRNVTIQGRLIDDLLDLTRIERRQLDLAAQPCVPAVLLRDAAAIAMPEFDAREQTLTVHCHLPENWRISGDPARLQQVLWNLLQNAARFSPSRTRINLTARMTTSVPAQIEIAVEDEGPGIPAGEWERIFRPFEQVRSASASRHSGLGLGLPIARAIVELHGGRLGVGPGPNGRGSRFTVELPLVLAGARPASDPGLPGATAAGSARHILLVEDHSDTGRVMAQLLKGAGHSVVHATTATEALQRFAQEKFDLLISDIGLPDENGLALMRKLRELQPALPGICMTGYGMESDLRACREAGFSEHLAKPVDIQRLHAAINRVARPDARLTEV